MKTPTTLWVVLVALLVGFGAGRMWSDHPAEAAQQATEVPQEQVATATRKAELQELADLRTKVAEMSSPAVCTPAPEATATATPTPVPPVEAGQPLPYPDDWTVTVTGASSRSTIDSLTAAGAFILVDMTITNDSAEQRTFPFRDFELVDGEGRVYAMSTSATTLNRGVGWALLVRTSLPTDFTIAFEVAADAGQSFILQSREDPTFRVRIELVQRG